MPTFRFHKGSLEESMETCVVVKNKHELAIELSGHNHAYDVFGKDAKGVFMGSVVSTENLIIKEYCFDKRIGWNTHIVLVKPRCVTQDPYVVGFLSDNLED